MKIPRDLSDLTALAGEAGDRPFDHLERKKPGAKAREAVAQSSHPPQVKAALFLYLDCFDEAHDIAQNHEGTLTGNWLHAIVHRREPDASNSKYWYARVDLPPEVSRGIAEEIQRMGTIPALEPLYRKVSESGSWEPAAFVDLCGKFLKKSPQDPAYQTLAKIQEIEWRYLLEFILAGG
jgi:hypothetical protein